MPAILDPLPDVAMHVMKAKRICIERADGRGLLCVPLTAAAIAIRAACADLIAPSVLRLFAGARRKLPLRLGQQSIGLAGLARQPRQVLGGDVIPRNVDCGPPAAAPA